MSLHRDAAAGTLDEGKLNGYLKTSNINEPSKQRGEGTIGLTPLALAARNGHAATVSLLLSHGAKADGLSSSNRTPLWLVTARGQGENRAEIVELLLKKGADPKHSHPSLQGGSTPLENELKQLRDPNVVRLLVNKKGVTQKATELAAELGDPIINDVMQSTEERTKSRDNAVNLIFGFIHWGVTTAGTFGVNGIVNKAVKTFQFARNRDNAVAKKIAEVGYFFLSYFLISGFRLAILTCLAPLEGSSSTQKQGRLQEECPGFYTKAQAEQVLSTKRQLSARKAHC